MKFKIRFWRVKNFGFEFWKWWTPCPCGCDERGMNPNNRLIGYWRNKIGYWGFTIMVIETEVGELT